MLHHKLRVLAVVTLAVAALAGYNRPALAQRPPRDCTVRKEPNGLVRGDKIPKGCVLVNEDEPPSPWRSRSPQHQRAVWHSCEYFSERFSYTPNVRKSVLANVARMCPQGITGRASVPADSARRAVGAVGSNRNFGPVQRPFGTVQRPFGTVQRPFGRLQRPFGSRAPARAGSRAPGK
jgi:hypothetical protein